LDQTASHLTEVTITCTPTANKLGGQLVLLKNLIMEKSPVQPPIETTSTYHNDNKHTDNQHNGLYCDIPAYRTVSITATNIRNFNVILHNAA